MAEKPVRKAEAQKAAPKAVQVGAEQLIYAALLEKLMLAGLGIMFVTFAIYVFGIMDCHVPVGKLSQCWNLSVHDYLLATGICPGWWWCTQLGKGDFLNFIGIALLAGVTIVCYAAIIPALLRKKDMAYAIMAIAEVVVLSAAASGLIVGGGH